MANQTGIRQRLQGVIRERHGDVSKAVLRDVAEAADVSYTTLARFLLYTGKRRTHGLRARTISALGRALDVRPEWLVDGQGDRQLAFWPRLDTPSSDSLGETDGDLEDLSKIFTCIRDLPAGDLRIRLCRAAVAACLDAGSRDGLDLAGGMYEALLRLDARLRYRREKSA